MTERYAIEVVGKLPRRQAEALALELGELARQHQLTVTRVTVQPVTRRETDAE
jgi:hypothetical protein